MSKALMKDWEWARDLNDSELATALEMMARTMSVNVNLYVIKESARRLRMHDQE